MRGDTKHLLTKCLSLRLMFTVWTWAVLVSAAYAQDHASLAPANGAISSRINNLSIQSVVESSGGGITADRCSEINVGSVVLKDRKHGEGECPRATTDHQEPNPITSGGISVFDERQVLKNGEFTEQGAHGTTVTSSVGVHHQFWDVSGNLESWTGLDWGASDYHGFLEASSSLSIGAGCETSAGESECVGGLYANARFSIISLDDGDKINEFFEDIGLWRINGRVQVDFLEVKGELAGPFRWSSEDGVFLGARAGAQDYLVQAETGFQFELFEIFGKKVVVCFDGHAGIGAEALVEAYYEDGKVQSGAGLGLGPGAGYSVCAGLID